MKLIKSKVKCKRASENKASFSVISPGQILKPVSGKFLWHINESTITQDLSKYQVIYAFEQAFLKIQPFIDPIKFEATGNANTAQIVISFAKNGDQILPEPFESGVLAYAYAPRNESYGLHADLFVNDLYKWEDMHKPGSFFLQKVVVHELLHSLNLGHSNDTSDIMYPAYQPNNDITITLDTKKGLYQLYKQFGVQNPEGDSDVTLVKNLFKSKADISILTKNQINILAEFLGVVFSNRDSSQVRISKLYNKIKSL